MMNRRSVVLSIGVIALACSVGWAMEGRLEEKTLSADAPLDRVQLRATAAGESGIPASTRGAKLDADATLTNDRLMVVLRRGAAGAELYARHGSQFVRRAFLLPTSGGRTGRLKRLSAVTDTPAEASVDAHFEPAGGEALVVRFRLAMGQPFVATESRQGATGLAVEAPCRYVVLPDFFADDLVIDAAQIPVTKAELPSENFLLQLLGRGESLLMTVTDSRDEDAEVRLSGQGADRLVDQSRFAYGRDGKIWVALLEGPRIWHQRQIAAGDAGQTIALDWKPPFAAQWRVDWRRDDRLTDSWEMITEKRGGEFLKLGWFGEPTAIKADRRRWTTVLGSFQYPCWIGRGGAAYLQPLAKKKVRFEGPAVIYPINRAPDTPLDALTVVDLVRATLGVGPCQYILDVEGQGQAMRGRATCATRDTLNPIYEAREQRSKRAEIERALVEVVVFVKHIRGRIEEYAAFGREIRAYLADQRKSHPELAGFLDDMDRLAGAIQENYDRRKAEIKTPQYVVDLTEKFRGELVDYEGADALDRCKEITSAIVKVGGNQDELVGESRMAVRILRQQAALAMAVDPRTAEVAKEIRGRSQVVLRNPASYEGARH